MAYSYQGTLSVSDSHQGTLSVSDDGSSGLVGELNYGVQSLSPVATSDYNTLTNKPRINNVELVGNITTERLGIRDGEDGFSPVITERETELGYDITITDVEGSNTITLKNGTNGTNGLNGTNGQDGKSAYEIAVEQGFVGTEQEWLESLKGQDGKDGIVMDAPSDGKVYGRMNANWVEVTDSGGITDAPADSKAYARKDNTWVETVEATNVYTKTEANEAFLPKTTVIPTKTSELTNDSGFITSIPDEYVTQTEMVGYAQPKGDYALKSELFSKDYNDLTNKPTIPTKTSDLTNDSGFITSIPDEYVTNTEMTAYAQPKGDYALKSELFSKSYNDLTDKPTIPTKTSELTNDSGFITSIDNILSTTSENPVQNKVITEELNKKIDSSIKGVANGVAELDSNGKVLTAQLPSYVDDVLEYSGISDFPTEGETGKIYVDTTTNKTYRWSGSTYIEISESIALGETSSTAYRGDRGKIAYDHSQSVHAPVDAEANVQSDWNETDTTSDAYILNKPTTLPANGGNADTVDGFHEVSFSRSRGDISDCNNAVLPGTYNAIPETINTPYSGYWFVSVETGAGGAWIRQTATISDSSKPNKTYRRLFINDKWSDSWVKVNDGGNADTVDGLHANEIASNPNLLINPNFAINQRGKTEYTSNGYTVDCWKIANSGITLDATGGGVSISSNSALSSNHATLIQEVPYDPLYGSVTLSMLAEKSHDNAYMLVIALDSGGSVVGQSAKVHIEEGKLTSVIYKTVPSGTVKLRIQVTLNSGTQPSDSLRIKYAKLESGTSATKFTPPDPATELAKCQRYFNSLFVDNGIPVQYVGSGIAVNDNMATILVNLPIEMRSSTPTVSLTGTLYLSDGSHTATNSIAVQSISGSYLNRNVLQLNLSSGATLNRTAAYLLSRRDKNTTLTVSAEL